ncbi:uncharacterized protein LOC110845017 [Folsomia candida]|uniref:uncharacterized protein LOC110845017 n=1 Tax=Folsomia candida TaxID=158441 RepID=UPI000B903B1E|nr:uncharacterized protein LOC110845017 [Folsomia candida]
MLLPLKLGVVKRNLSHAGVLITIYWLSSLQLSLSQIPQREPVETSRNNRVSFYQQPLPRPPGPNLVSGAIPLPLTQQFVPRRSSVSLSNPGITQNFVPMDENQRESRLQKYNNNNERRSQQQPRIMDPLASNLQRTTPLNPHLTINMGLSNVKNESVSYIRVSNNGAQDEFIQMIILDSKGHGIPVKPSEFPLGVGATAEIPFTFPMPRMQQQQQQAESQIFERSSLSSGRIMSINPSTPKSVASVSSSNMITVLARGKRDSVQRSFVFGDPYDGANYDLEPFCVDKDVTGTCRYRDDPIDCFRWEWTAYATILNNYGPNQKITSLPEGLFLTPGEHGRVRVYLKISCCTPYVQFIATDIHHHTALKSCVVDVRELQTLHPGEIAGIVIGVVLLIAIIIAIIVICVRRRRSETINNNVNNVSMIPRLRGRTRDKEGITRVH